MPNTFPNYIGGIRLIVQAMRGTNSMKHLTSSTEDFPLHLAENTTLVFSYLQAGAGRRRLLGTGPRSGVCILGRFLDG